MTDLTSFDGRAAETPILRRSLHDETVARLRDMIIDGRLAPGERVNEGDVGRRLGVSRTPMREALKTLAAEGLIENVPGRGAVVRAFTRHDVFDMLEALKIIEQEAARLACARASDADIASLRAVHDRMMELYAVRSRLNYFKLNQDIHSGFARISGNATLLWAHESIQARMKRIRFVGNGSEDKWAAAVAEHEEMIVALEAHDGDALAEVIGRHIDRTWLRVQDALPERAPAASAEEPLAS